jgi:hypothetical protein
VSPGASKPATYGRFKTSHPLRVVTVIESTISDGLCDALMVCFC